MDALSKKVLFSIFPLCWPSNTSNIVKKLKVERNDLAQTHTYIPQFYGLIFFRYSFRDKHLTKLKSNRPFTKYIFVSTNIQKIEADIRRKCQKRPILKTASIESSVCVTNSHLAVTKTPYFRTHGNWILPLYICRMLCVFVCRLT